MHKDIEPSFLKSLKENLRDSPQFIQVILGPRQVGKTTGILQLIDAGSKSAWYHTTDDVLAPTADWLQEKWQNAVLENSQGLLVIDEIQKIPQWSGVVKKLWDQQSREKKTKIKLVLLGSSSLQIQTGLNESLTGRFQLIQATHWDLSKSQELASNLDIESFVKYGGYPGSYDLLKKPKHWEKYIRESIIDTVIGKDILHIARVRNPALFRQAFEIFMSYPAQEISYTKLLGQLQDAGNTDLVKHYLELYEGAFLIKALQKYSGKPVLKRTSSPKLIPLCGALVSRDVVKSQDGYGRAFEASVGACLLNHQFEVFYWRDGNAEVDFVVPLEGELIAIEVKSGRPKSSKGLAEFSKTHKNVSPIYITQQNIEKLLTNPRLFIEKLR